MKKELNEYPGFEILTDRDRKFLDKTLEQFDDDKVPDLFYKCGMVVGVISARCVDDYKIKDLARLAQEDFNNTIFESLKNISPFLASISLMVSDGDDE